MKLVRGSEVQDFLRCRLRWSLAWVDGYKSKKQNGKLFFGTLLHKWLEAFYSNLGNYQVRQIANQAMVDLYRETDVSLMDPLELQDMWTLAQNVADSYFDHWRQNGDVVGYMDVIATELTFAIPLDDEIVYTGTIDLIYKDQDGNLWFADHKTTDSLEKYEKNAIMDRQISRYWWAIQQLAKGNGYFLTKLLDGTEDYMWVPVSDTIYINKLTEPYGFHYNLIKKDIPQPPKQLKNGSFSKDKAQNTTYELYMKALEDLGLVSDGHGMFVEAHEMPEYKDILNHLKENGKQYFRRIEVIRNQNEIMAAMREFYATVQDINEHTPKKPLRIYRNITADCHWDCAFKDVCHAGMDGSDVEYLLNIAFEKEQPNNEFNLSGL